MIRKILTATLLQISLQGCTTFNFDYIAPQGSNVAKVTIKSAWDGNNQRVIFLGSNTCNPNDARLVGLLNAAASGQRNVKQIEVIVPAGVEVKFSLPQIDLQALRADSATFRYCQPVVVFTPSLGQSYILEFGSCRADLYLNPPVVGGSLQEVPSKLDRSCNVTPENHGTDAKLFYLSEKRAP
jgi:hypothetical protein